MNETISLIGESRSTTIIDGNETGHVIEVQKDNVTITGFTVQGSNPYRAEDVYGAIHLYSVAYCNISGNHLTNNSVGIILAYSDRNVLARNNIVDNWGAIALTWDCDRNTISRNNVSGCEEWASIYVDMSEYNTITRNCIDKNARGVQVVTIGVTMLVLT